MLAMSAGCQTRNDEPVPEPEPEPDPVAVSDIYVAGYFLGDGRYTDAPIPCYWKNGERFDLIPEGASDNIDTWEPPQGIFGFAHAVFVDAGDLYIAGYVNLEKHSIAYRPCFWKNGVRSDLDIGDANEGRAHAIFVSHGEVYACGYTHNWITHGQTACYWKNGTRIDLPSRGSYGSATSIFVSNGCVCVSGNFWNSGFTATFGYWQNGTWNELFSSSRGGKGGLDAIVADGNDTYAAGWTDSTTTQNVPSYWKNGVRTDLSVLDPPRSGRANAIVLSGSDLYVAGWTKNNQIVAIPCFWKNGLRTDLSVLDPNYKYEMLSSGNAIQVRGNDVYIAGNTYIGRKAVPCFWKNGIRTDLSMRESSTEGYGRSIFVTGN
jgi:hypothetical protein